MAAPESDPEDAPELAPEDVPEIDPELCPLDPEPAPELLAVDPELLPASIFVPALFPPPELPPPEEEHAPIPRATADQTPTCHRTRMFPIVAIFFSIHVENHPAAPTHP
jgi:hypothetical protein